MPWDVSSRGEILVVDNDASMREALRRALEQKGYVVISFADSAALLSHTKSSMPLCIFLEVNAFDPLGFDLLKKLHVEKFAAPVLVTSATGSIPMAVQAIKHGAYDYIVKPICGDEIARRVEAAIDEYSEHAIKGDGSSMSLYVSGIEPLTKREREVLAGVSLGDTNKEIARKLGLSARTVEGYRAGILRKVGAKNATELLQRVLSGRESSTRRRGPSAV